MLYFFVVVISYFKSTFIRTGLLNSSTLFKIFDIFIKYLEDLFSFSDVSLYF